MLEYIILGVINNLQLTGYEIRKCIESKIGMFYKASFGSIYPLLAGLLEKGMITCVEDENANRNQKRYSITPKGEEYFYQWLSDPTNIEYKTESFMAKIFFMDALKPEEARVQIQIFRKHTQTFLEDLMAKSEQYKEFTANNQYYYRISTLYYGIAKLQGIIEWCNVIEKQDDLTSLTSK